MKPLRPAPNYLLDTHIWFWYLTGSSRLSPGLRKEIDSPASDLWYSPISVWELGMLAERQRIRIGGEIRAWIDEALIRLPLQEAPLNREIALLSLGVTLPHRDPADRFLAATAMVYDLILMTVDTRLSKARWLLTRSR